MPRTRAVTVAFLLALASCHRLTSSEQKLVGTWSYSGMDFTTRVEFRADRTMATLMGDDDGRAWTPVTSGTWRVESNDLFLEEQALPNPHPLPGDTPRPKESGRMTIREITPDKLSWQDPRFPPYIRVK